METVTNRLNRLAKQKEADVLQDVAELETLQSALQQVRVEDFSKYQRMLKLIQKDFSWTGRDPKDRLVLFTGRLETLRFLQAQLATDLKLKPEAIAILDGGLADVDQTRIVEAFGQENAKVRILLATEVASEGLNLHYQSHKLIHFDIPWSLMTLQQRNGRIDRYGQTRQPEIRYLLTRSQIERMDEVERIIKVLLEKDEQAIKNIGDPSVFMGVFEAEAEEEVTAKAIEVGVSAADFSQQLDQNATSGDEFNIFDWFENEDVNAESVPEVEAAETGTLLSLFSSTFKYAIAALQSLETLPPNLNINETDRFVELQLPAELERRYERLPREIRPTGLMHLTDRPGEMMKAMEEARRQETSWTDKQYLWDLHPLVEWLSDRCLFRFGRHQAPVLLLNEGMAEQEVSFVLFGSFPNRRGSPVINRWVAAVFEKGKFKRIEPFAETTKRTGLGQRPIPNPGAAEVADLVPLRKEAIAKALAYLQAERKTFDFTLAPKLKEQQERLERLQGHHLKQLELRFEGDKRPETIKQQRRQGELSYIEKIFKDYRDWVELSMTTEPDPYIKLVAVFRRNG